MESTQEGYTVVPFPKARHIYMDSLYLGQRKHTVYGLIEADVTSARQFIRQVDRQRHTGLFGAAFKLRRLAG